MVDECHSVGTFGKTGRGTVEHFGLEGQVDLISSTLAKSLGGATGGYNCGLATVIMTIMGRARPYVFSSAISPVSVAGAIEAVNILNESSELVEKLLSNTHLFRKEMTKLGFKIEGHPDCAIAPVNI